MLSESFVVAAVSEDRRVAEVSGARQSACGSCSAKVGCGYGMLNAQKSSQTFSLPLGASYRDLVAGEVIRLRLPARVLLKLAFRAYIQPLLLTMVLVTWVFMVAPSQTGLQALALLFGLGFGALWSLARSSTRQEVADTLEISKCSHTN
jgi:sigma-E factor negative regulatory protein RseC